MQKFKIKTYETKVFKSGNSQAIRIPKNFQLAPGSVFIHKNEEGELIISTRTLKLSRLYNFLNKHQTEFKNFMEVREDLPAEEKDLF